MEIAVFFILILGAVVALPIPKSEKSVSLEETTKLIKVNNGGNNYGQFVTGLGFVNYHNPLWSIIKDLDSNELNDFITQLHHNHHYPIENPISVNEESDILVNNEGFIGAVEEASLDEESEINETDVVDDSSVGSIPTEVDDVSGIHENDEEQQDSAYDESEIQVDYDVNIIVPAASVEREEDAGTTYNEESINTDTNTNDILIPDTENVNAVDNLGTSNEIGAAVENSQVEHDNLIDFQSNYLGEDENIFENYICDNEVINGEKTSEDINQDSSTPNSRKIDRSTKSK